MAAAYPGMVERVIRVIGAGVIDVSNIGWMDVWAAPIRLDPNWNGGDYYGKEPPLAGLTEALKIVTLHAQHWQRADETFGRAWAKEGNDPAAAFDNAFAIEAALEQAGAARAADGTPVKRVEIVGARGHLDGMLSLAGGRRPRGVPRRVGPSSAQPSFASWHRAGPEHLENRQRGRSPGRTWSRARPAYPARYCCALAAPTP